MEQVALYILETVFAVFLGILIADILTGVFHYIEDNMGRTGIKWFDQAIIIPNEEHHTRPYDFTKNGFWNRNNTTIAAASMVAIPIGIAFGFSVTLLTAWLFGSMANQFHYWSHIKNPPKLVVILQKYNLLLNRKDHGLHHRPPNNLSFCTITSLLNPIYNWFVKR